MLSSRGILQFLIRSHGFKHFSERNWPFSRCFQRQIAFSPVRNITTTSVDRLKEIRETVTDNKIVIEGATIESEKKDHLFKPDDGSTSNACPLCRLNLDLEHTDVLILAQFVEPNGNMLSRRVTGLCKKQQKLVQALVDQAKKAGLMPNHYPSWFQKRYSRKYAWKMFNRYFVPEPSGNKTKRYQ